MRKPDFFIVGAPKSGTTAMYTYLKAHPDIFLPDIKEPNFFGSDLTGFKIKTLEEYLNLYKKCPDNKICGDCSVWYLYSRTAAHQIYEINPASKIIIMLRNPVELMYSLHSQALYLGFEDIEDFKVALEFESYRKAGKNVPKTCKRVEALFYRDVVRFTAQVKRYLDIFGPEKVLIILFEEFKQNPSKIYQQTLNFLNVNESFQPPFKIINPNKRVRSKKLMFFIQNKPKFLKWIGRLFIPRPLRQNLTNILIKLNTKYQPRPPLDPVLNESLKREFRHEIEQLSKLINKDLTIWL